MNFDVLPSRAETGPRHEQAGKYAGDLREILHNEGEERLEELKTTLRSLVVIGGSASAVLHSLEGLQHEAISQDDSGERYRSVSQDIEEINRNLAAISTPIVL